jgi:hypothetical protein
MEALAHTFAENGWPAQIWLRDGRKLHTLPDRDPQFVVYECDDGLPRICETVPVQALNWAGAVPRDDVAAHINRNRPITLDEAVGAIHLSIHCVGTPTIELYKPPASNNSRVVSVINAWNH